MKYFSNICKAAMLLFAMNFANMANALDLALAAQTRYYGICDGSAAMRIDGDTLIVANDETNTLYSYDIWGGVPHIDSGSE